MDKLKTRILLISVLLLLLFSVQSVVAVSNDDDGNLTSESIDLSICDNTGDISSNELSNNPVDVLSVSNELDVLSADEVSYSELDSEISVGGNIELLHDYYRCYGGESTISISGNNRVIDGRGAVIDMAGSTIRAFNVVGSGITIKNLTIKNANFNGNGAAIYFSSHGTVENCNFTNNSAKYGGAITFESIGTVRNCNFTNNSARIGGAITFEMMLGVTHEVSNCKFVNNKATALGGAVYFVDNGEVTNCNFTDNIASEGGGAIMFNSAGNVTDCNFTNNNATRYGGAIYFYSNGQSSNVTNCNFTDNSANCGGAVYFRYSGNGTVTNCNFTINTADYGGSIYFESSSGNVVSCNFVNGSSYYGGAVFWLGDNGCISDCNFTGNTAVRRGGAVHWGDTETEPDSQSDYEKAKNGTITRSNFINNTAAQGGAVFWFANDGNITDNCYFKDNNATAEGGAVYWKGNKGHISNKCTFTDNEAITYGGAIFWQGDNGALTDNCRFIKNSAYSQGTEGIYRGGGAIFWNGNNATVSDNCSFINNTADTSEGGGFLDSYRGGGAIYITGTESHVSDSSFVGNYAAHYGGAVYAVGGNSNVDGCSFENNSAKKGGAAFTAASDYSYISNCIFVNNFGIDFTSNGGAVNFRNYDNSLSNCTFIDNYAEDCGGAVYWLRDGRSDVFNCSFENNHAYSLGGALFCEYGADISYCSFVNNGVTGFSSSAGAIYMGSAKSIENCNFTNNTASSNGGAVYFNKNSEGNVTNCNFTGNTASLRGGAVYFYQGTGSVTNCNFTNNKATGTGNYDGGGAVYFYSAGSVTNCNFTNNTASGDGGAIHWHNHGESQHGLNYNTIRGCSFVNNTANYNNEGGGALYFTGEKYTVTVEDCNFKGNSAPNGGAIYFLEGYDAAAVSNCNFVDNKETGDYSYGGAVYFDSNGEVTNCNFVDNKATGDYSYGGAIYIYSGTVTNCNFVNNSATGEGIWGGAIRMYSGTVSNCNFTDNSASGDGGAINMYSGAVSNCNFVDNKAAGDYSYGGAVYFSSTGTVTNCNFTGNNATHGGAVFFYEDGDGDVTNCNFTGNTATYNGGAVFFMNNGNVTNCNFTGNTATGSNSWGGAINMYSGTVSNCNFTDNTATYGGAINIGYGTVSNCNFTGNTATGDGGAIWMLYGTVSNCNFTGNNATHGGAVYFESTGNVTNCNFTGNNATTGSAIYFYSTSAQKSVSNSTFLNNRANAEALDVVKNDNNITITFTGRNNLLNAIYSRNNAEVTFTNVTYWGAKGITTISSTKSGSNNEAGQNITILVVVNDELVLNEVNTTDDNGTIVLDVKVDGDYYIRARHDTDSYYTEAEKTISNNTKFNVNVTSQTTTNKTVNITAKSNIFREVMPGKLLFILPNSEEISANYGGNGTWWAVHTFDDYGVYEVNASYTGLDNVTVNNGTVTINDVRLSVVKSADKTEVTYNSTVQFTINITNYGSTEATNVEVSDWLPEGLTFIEAGVINSEGQYEVFDSPDLLILIGDEEFVTFFEFSSSDIIEDGGVERDIAQWSITRIAGGNSVILLITARANGLVMGNITNEVTVRYHENETDSIVNSTNITVIPANSSVSAEDVEVTYGDSIVVVVTSENATGVSYKVIGKDGIVKEGTVNVGENITGLDLAAGDYTVNLTTMVNGNYTASNYTSKITVKPANSSVSAEDVEVTYGKSIVVVVTSDNATGVSYMVIGKEGIVKEGTVNVGENITGLDLAAGDYTVNLTTMVNGNYATANYTSKITVKPANSSVKAEDVEVTYGDSIVVVVTSENATNVSYQIISSGAIVKEGTINIGENITGLDLAAGEYTVNLTTVVNSNYTAANYTSKITVKPANSTVSAEDAVASFGDAVSIPVSSVNATEISYRIIDANDKAVANGTVKPDNPISVSDLAAGDYTVSLTTVVDENHTSVSNSSKLHIRHVVSIVIAPVTGYACETVSFTVQFKYENGDPVSEGTAGLTVKYDNKELLAASRYPILSADESVPVSNGKATFNVKVDNPGTYPYVVTYSGGDADDVQAESTLTILKVNTTVSGVDISGKPDDKKDVTVTVLDYNNNPVANGTVTLTLNGKTYNSTVENGKAVLSVELPNPGEYNATVTYKGNDHYDSSSSSISVNVEKVNTKAPSAEDVSGKAGEKKDIKVKIVDENGNPVKNGTATLTVDGKTYTAEVINGVATFKGVVIPDEDTVADVYYQGNDYYNASSATISIKVKHDNNNTEPDNNDTDENKTTKHVSSEIVDANATGNPIAMMLLALCALVITYRKK